MVEEICITFFWLGTLATARDAASSCLVYIYVQVVVLEDTENLAHCFALLLYCIISYIPAEVL
jgi:hypothetical protein